MKQKKWKRSQEVKHRPHDHLGREIASYAASELKGKKEVQIGSSLKNGIYFVRVETTDGSFTKKVNIIK